MAKTPTAAFAQNPKTFTVVATGAVSGLATDAPTNTVELLTAGTEGAIVTSVTAMPRGTVTASSLLLFLSKDGGATKRLLASALMQAHTVSATTMIPVSRFDFSEMSPLRLEAGDRIFVGTAVLAADGIVFSAQATDY